MSRPTYVEDLNGCTRQFPSWGEAYDFVIARNKGDEHWSILGREPSAPENPTEADYLEAGRRVAEGIFEVFARKPTMFNYRTPEHIQGSEQRNAHWNAELAARQRDARMAALDRCLIALAKSQDITRFLEAAE
jgi:hypothetical protein